MDVEVAGTRIIPIVGDLTQQDVDAIVNAANVELRHGAGVAGAIVRAGGPEIQRESDAWVAEHGVLTDGAAAVTSGGQLRAEHVVHVAGPIFEPARDDNAQRLRLAVRAALDAAAAAGARTVALPAISSGVYGYPLAEAANEITAAVVAWCQRRPGDLDEIRLVGFAQEAQDAFTAGLDLATG